MNEYSLAKVQYPYLLQLMSAMYAVIILHNDLCFSLNGRYACSI